MQDLYKINTKMDWKRPEESSTEDIMNTKHALNALGHYKTQSRNYDNKGDLDFFDSVKSYQNKKNLRIDGLIKPGGATEKKLNEDLKQNEYYNGLNGIKPIVPFVSKQRERTPVPEDRFTTFPTMDKDTFSPFVAKRENKQPERPIYSTPPFIPPQREIPWYRSGRLPGIPQKIFQENRRTVAAVLEEGRHDRLADLFSRGLERDEEIVVGEYGDFLNQLHEKSPEKAAALEKDVNGKLSPRGIRNLSFHGGKSAPEEQEGRKKTLHGTFTSPGDELYERYRPKESKLQKPLKTLSPEEIKDAEEGLRRRVETWRKEGLPEAADNLEHFLKGKGAPKIVTREQAMKEEFYRDGEKKNENRFENTTFLGNLDEKNPQNRLFNEKLKNMKDGDVFSYQDHWDHERGSISTGKSIFFPKDKKERDDALAKGNKKFRSTAYFRLQRKGDKIFIDGFVHHDGGEVYDFEKGIIKSLPKDARRGQALQDAGIKEKFGVRRDWLKKIEGTIDLDDKAKKVSNPVLKWEKMDDTSGKHFPKKRR